MIIYIAGYGRSGSTILELILNSKEEVIGLGEITNIFEPEVRDNLSPFWQKGLSEILAATELSVDEANFLSRKGDSKNLHNRDFHKYKLLWQLLFEYLLASINEKNISFIDSSKTTSKSKKRAANLQKMGYDIKIIHLIRNPFEVINSAKKGSNRKLEKGIKEKTSYFIAVKTFISWFYTNLNVKFFYRKPKYKKLVINYNNLRDDFQNTTLRLSDFLKINYQPESILSSNLKPKNDLGISGNRLRRKEAVKLEFKENDLNIFQKRIGEFLCKILS